MPSRLRPHGETTTRFAASKFAAPTLSPTWVTRADLLDRLDGVDDCGLAVVLGSPGAGKSSLLAQWVARRGAGRTCWINVDDADRDHIRFWRALVAAVGQVEPGFGGDCVDLLRLADGADPAFFESLLEAAEGLAVPVVLVLDDFQHVGRTTAEQLRFVLARGFGQVRVVVGSRREPAIGLDKRRLSGGLVEVRETDLRFDRDDASMVFDRLGVRVRPADLDVVLQRTEGWVAGLQMAGVVLRDVERPDRFVAELSGTSGIISHYLWSELFAVQPAQVQRFLLDTCVADELSPGLAAALSPDNTVSLLDIEASNLLIVRLDPNGESFRYHHLLIEMLRARLRATEPDHEYVLHARAARWLIEHGNAAAAFRHQWWAGRRAEAISSIHNEFLDAYFASDLPSLAGTERTLTDDDIVAAPGPAVSFCIAYIVNGLADDARRLAARIETLAGGRLRDDERTQLVAVRTIESIVRCDTAATIRNGEELRQRGAGPGAGGDWYRLGLSALLRAYSWEGDTTAADETVRALGEGGPSALEQIELRSAIAQHRLLCGELGDAAALAGEALAESIRRGASDVSIDLLATAVLGCAQLERGEVTEAQERLQRVSAEDSRFRVLAGVVARLGLGRIALASGDLDGAWGALDAADALLHRAPSSSAVLDHVRSQRVRVVLERDGPDAAADVAATIHAVWPRAMSRCRIAWTTGRTDDAIGSLTDLSNLATSHVRRLELAVAELAIALADGSRAGAEAGVAFALASREGHTFMLAEAGQPVLAAVQDHARRQPVSDYVVRLLRAVPGVRAARPPLGVHPADALSNRELTVLRHLATSLSYREIADQLYVSVNTVKTHAHHILRKLQVTSRADAIVRARQLHYL